MKTDWDNKTVGEAKAYLRKNINEGSNCPCCQQNVKQYRRTITSAMAYALILMYNKKDEDYFHIENYLKEMNCPPAIRGDVPKLRFWGLIEPKAEDREDGSNRNGFYRITRQGIKFVNLQLTIPSHVKIYNNKFYGYESEKFVSITDCLKKKFNYNKLMNHEESNTKSNGKDSEPGTEDFNPFRAAC